MHIGACAFEVVGQGKFLFPNRVQVIYTVDFPLSLPQVQIDPLYNHTINSAMLAGERSKLLCR
ncbi:MAG TPA: hypothetical protein ENJ19_10100 [Gammaproteobacteria bacterium]|nr:hypothetical protein [Gammaproteobacteria bacterium]